MKPISSVVRQCIVHTDPHKPEKKLFQLEIHFQCNIKGIKKTAWSYGLEFGYTCVCNRYLC